MYEDNQFITDPKSLNKVFWLSLDGILDRPLTKKLRDFVLTGPMVVWTVSGALEVHSLALEDKLKGREAELTEEIIDATCTDEDFNEMSEYPRSLSCPGHLYILIL